MTRRGERGAVLKATGSFLPVALVYPNVYRVGMANLGFQFVYQYINSFERLSAERFFLPDSTSRDDRTIWLPMAEESGRRLSDYPIIAFSVPFENDYPAVPGILLAAGIPPLQKDRGPHDPIVIAGGVSVSMNPEPLADFLDLVYIGEIADDRDAVVPRDSQDESAAKPTHLEQGEQDGLLPSSSERDSGPGTDTPALFALLAELLGPGSPGFQGRREFLRQFRNVPGVYVPSAYTWEYEGTTSRIVHREPGFPERVRAVKRRSKLATPPTSVLFTPDAEFGETFLIEVNRGCSRGCRFCAAGWIHFPVRHRRFETFRPDVDRAMEAGRTIGLIGSDLASHPQLEEILTHIIESGGRFSLSSIRPEGLTPRVIQLLATTGQKTATLAPEVASLRLKRAVGKDIPSDRFFELVEQLVAAGIPNVRFYFMIGLPTEIDEDVQAIVGFVLRARQIFVQASRGQKKIGRINVQVNPFVPKPWTPFQWYPMASRRILESRSRIVRKGLSGVPNVKVRIESAREAMFQALLSRGDRRIAQVLLELASTGTRFLTQFTTHGIGTSDQLDRQRLAAEPFAWDLMDHGISRERLLRVRDTNLGVDDRNEDSRSGP